MQNTKDSCSSLNTNSLNDDLKFLINCCKIDPTEEDIKVIFSYLNAERLTLNTLIPLANQHGILPLVYKTIKNLQPNSSSHHTQHITHSTLLSEIKPLYMSIVQRNMLMTSELIKIMHLLRENNIEALAFKGPSLSQMAYGDITLRQYGDLDILIPPKDLFNAANILLKNDYILQGAISFLNDPIWIEATKDMTLFHDKKNIVLEMHWKLFQSTFANTQKIDLWHKTEKIKINQVDILTLDRNLLLSYLCIHGSRHLWERVEWIVDIDRLIREIEINWNEVFKTAELFQSKTMLLLGLSLSHLLLGTSLPKVIQQMIQTKKIQRLTVVIINLLENPLPKESSTTDIMYRKRIHAAMQNGFYNKMMFWKNVLFKKNYTVILAENKPNNHHTLFTFKRPYRLLKKFFFKRN